jgi:TM2 domain-containing membrane protein YozV
VSRRSIVIAYILWALVGYLGVHRFYLRDWGWGVLYLLTGGLFSIGWFVDAFLIPGRVDERNREFEAHQSYRLAPARVVRVGPPS